MKIKSILSAIIQVDQGKHLKRAFKILDTTFNYRKMFEQYIQVLLTFSPTYISIAFPIKMLVSIIKPTGLI